MIKRCNHGHWYDTGIHKTCPHCKQESEKLRIGLNDIEEDDHTISFAEAEISLGEELNAIIGNSKGIPMPEAVNEKSDDDKTISF